MLMLPGGLGLDRVGEPAQLLLCISNTSSERPIKAAHAALTRSWSLTELYLTGPRHLLGSLLSTPHPHPQDSKLYSNPASHLFFRTELKTHHLGSLSSSCFHSGLVEVSQSPLRPPRPHRAPAPPSPTVRSLLPCRLSPTRGGSAL